MNASLDKMLQEIEWGEYRLGDLFENIEQGRRLKKQDHLPGEIPFVMAGATDTGVANYISNPVSCFPQNAITVDILGNTFYRSYAFGAGDDTGVYWNTKKQYSEAVMLYLTAAIGKAVSGLFNYGNKLRSSRSYGIKVKLPVKNGKINFSFMEKFIAELEAQRIAELEAYLLAAGLTDYILTAEEERALQELNAHKMSLFRIGDLFERIETNKLPYKANDLPKTPTERNTLPCLTSSFQNQGLNYYVPVECATVLKNVISIPSNSDVYRAYFQSRDFTVLSDAYAIQWKYTDAPLSSKQYLFFVQCINKVTDLPTFSYKNKLGGWNVVKDLYIELPVKAQEIDLPFMDLLVSAIQKMVIKDVVLYANREVAKTKAIVNDEKCKEVNV